MTNHLTKRGHQTNYRIPPESTGDRVYHFEHWYLKVTNLSSFITPADISFGSNDVVGLVHTIEEYEGGQRLLVTVPRYAGVPELTVDDTVEITLRNGSKLSGILREFEPVLTPATTVVNPDHPEWGLAIDKKGAASVRFTEGEPQLSAYGLLRMAEPTRLADYRFTSTLLPTQFQSYTAGSGSIAVVPARGYSAMDVGIDSGDIVTFTSNRYMRFTPGSSNLFNFTVACDHSGKAGNVARWGYFTGAHGLFFELNENGMHVGFRTITSGAPTEVLTGQQDWNQDRADGTDGEFNASQMNLDPTMVNTYWIDVQWPTGQVRFGVWDENGVRLVLHQMNVTNNAPEPYLLAAMLPLRFEIENTGGTASPSRLKVTSTSAFRDGKYAPDEENANAEPKALMRPDLVDVVSGAETLVAAFRAGNMAGGPRHLIVPKMLNLYVQDTPMQMIVRAGTVLSSGTWAQAAYESKAEVCYDGVVSFPGIDVSHNFLLPGGHKQQVSDTFNSLGQALNSLADGSPGTIYTLWFVPVDGVSTGKATAGIEWLEVK